jgi:hypothetical protein
MLALMNSLETTGFFGGWSPWWSLPFEWSLLPEWAESDKSLLDFVADTVVLTSTSTGTCDEFFLPFALSIILWQHYRERQIPTITSLF